MKINDWELAAYVCGPVSEPHALRAAADRLRDAGARSVIVTRGEQPAFVLHESAPGGSSRRASSAAGARAAATR